MYPTTHLPSTNTGSEAQQVTKGRTSAGPSSCFISSTLAIAFLFAAVPSAGQLIVDRTTLRNNEKACTQSTGRAKTRCQEELGRTASWNERHLKERRRGLQRGEEKYGQLAREWNDEARRHGVKEWTVARDSVKSLSSCVVDLRTGLRGRVGSPRSRPRSGPNPLDVASNCVDGVNQFYESGLETNERRMWEKQAENAREKARHKREQSLRVEDDLWRARELQDPSLRQRPWDRPSQEPNMTPWNPGSTPAPVQTDLGVPLGFSDRARSGNRRKFDWGKLANGLTTTLNVLTQVGSAYVQTQGASSPPAWMPPTAGAGYSLVEETKARDEAHGNCPGCGRHN